MKDETILLAEVFNTFQGEGLNSGLQMLLCRVKYCNRRCRFCDTLVKLRVTSEAIFLLSNLQKTINEYRLSLLVTGGECTIDRHFDDTLKLLNKLNYPLANVETNGCQLEKLIKLVSPTKNVHYIYSPKIFSEQDLIDATNLTEKLLSNEKVFIKVVYENNPLIDSYLDWLSGEITLNQYNKVWLMPEGTTRDDLLKHSGIVFDACEKYKFNFSSRSHIIYGFV